MFSNGYGSVPSGVPYGSIFGHTVLIMAVLIAGLFLGMWLIGKLFKSEATPVECFNVAVSSQVPMVCALFIGMILSYISIQLCMLVINLGGVLLTVCAYVGYQKVLRLEEDKTVYALPLAFFVMYVCLYLGMKVFIMPSLTGM